MSPQTPRTPASSSAFKASWANFVSPTPKSSPNGDSKNQGTHTNVAEIEKIIGFVSEQYECVHNNFAGTLYSGPLAVVWLGRIFFFEWTVVIKWEDVAQVQKRNDGVRFKVRTPKEGIYDFVKLFNPEKAWSNLVSLHNDTILDKPRREPTPRQVTRSLRRMNSDPSRMSMMFYLDDGLPVGVDDRSPLKNESLLRKKRESSIISRSASAPVDKEMDTVKESNSQESLDACSPSVSQRKLSMEHQWSSVLQDSASYAETAVERQELSCTLDSFFDLFIADDAKYSVPKFMEESGDKELQCSPWADESDGFTKTRTIEYNHPINAPMAPPMAGAKKEQTYRRFGKNGVVLETRTYVSDVPMTDCFYVRDQILVEPIDDHVVSITMSFDLEFVKSTMFKAIIMRTAKGEFESFMQRLANFMTKSLGQAITVSVPPPTPVASSTDTASSLSDNFPKLVVGLLSLVLFFQIWIILDVRSVKVTLYQLQSMTPTECRTLDEMSIFGWR